MAELRAIQKDLKNLKPKTTLSPDGTAVTTFGGNSTYKPMVLWTAAEIEALRQALTKPTPMTGTTMIGLGGLWGWGVAPCQQVAAETGIKHVRVELTFANTIADLANVKAAVVAGLVPVLLYNRPHALRTPSVIAADMQQLANLIYTFDLPPVIEERNEPYYERLSPAAVANDYRIAREALGGTGIKLLAKAWGDYQDLNTGKWSQQDAGEGWCVDFCKALLAPPDAWSVHPYGPLGATGPFGGGRPFGWGSVQPLMDFLAKQGIGAPMWVTEVGTRTSVGSDGGAQVTEDEQGMIYAQYIQRARKLELAGLFLYEGIDSGEGGYGLYTWPFKAKKGVPFVAAAVAEGG